MMVRDHTREAEEEVAELRRLLAEAEKRRVLIETGQGTLTWWDSLMIVIARLLWGEGPTSDDTPRTEEIEPEHQDISDLGLEMSF